ncbi:MAG TPA: trypsin-like peptidase domain-containing protein, partial [Chloroflexia bacterium]|nr:trypsin-like peptidase domain-containing protein [Chloroflexia bacterium]
LGGAGAQATNLMVGRATPAAAAVVAPADTGSTVQMIIADSALTIGGLYKQVAPSVVLIEVTATTSAGRRSMVSQASGSGIVLDTQGDVLTNYHVVAGATSITVRAGTDGPYTATVVRTAATQDLAVVRVNSGADQLVPATFGDSSTVQVGDQVLAIGYPYDLGETLTAGIVSGLDRSQSAASSGAALSGLIQVDAAINPGNSGGALVDAQGQVIGINTMIESPVEGFTGVGLAIPINQVRPLITQLAAGGTVQ